MERVRVNESKQATAPAAIGRAFELAAWAEVEEGKRSGRRLD